MSALICRLVGFSPRKREITDRCSAKTRNKSFCSRIRYLRSEHIDGIRQELVRVGVGAGAGGSELGCHRSVTCSIVKKVVKVGCEGR